MDAVTMAGVVSTMMFAGSNLPMVVQAVRTRDVSSYSRGYLVMTNVGNAVYTVYVLSLPAGPIWLLHLMYTSVSAFMLIVHVWWAPSSRRQTGHHSRPRVSSGLPRNGPSVLEDDALKDLHPR